MSIRVVLGCWILTLLPALCPAAGAPAMANPEQTSSLVSLQWKQRVLLVFAAHPDQAELREQAVMLDRESAALTERDVLWIRVIADQVQADPGIPAELPTLSAAALRNQYAAATVDDSGHVKRSAFAVVLLGKDGQVKLHSRQVVPIRTLLALIDSMPMRRREMGQD